MNIKKKICGMLVKYLNKKGYNMTPKESRPINIPIKYTVKEPIKICARQEIDEFMLMRVSDKEGYLNYIRNDISRAISNTDEFKSLIVYDEDYNQFGNRVITGYVEVLKDK